jgi:hypothetical protein
VLALLRVARPAVEVGHPFQVRINASQQPWQRSVEA